MRFLVAVLDLGRTHDFKNGYLWGLQLYMHEAFQNEENYLQ